MVICLAGVPCLKKEWVDEEEQALNEKITPEHHAKIYEKQHWWIWVIPGIVFLIVIIIISVIYSNNKNLHIPDEAKETPEGPHPTTFNEVKSNCEQGSIFVSHKGEDMCLYACDWES